MPTNSFSTGRDIKLSIITPQVGLIDLDLVTGFNSRPITTTDSPKALDSIVRHVRFFMGWQGSFSVIRRSSLLDDYYAIIEQQYWAGVSEPSASITAIIAEQNGALTEWRYPGTLLTLDDAGTWRGDQTVAQSVSFLSSKRLKIA